MVTKLPKVLGEETKSHRFSKNLQNFHQMFGQIVTLFFQIFKKLQKMFQNFLRKKIHKVKIVLFFFSTKNAKFFTFVKKMLKKISFFDKMQKVSIF